MLDSFPNEIWIFQFLFPYPFKEHNCDDDLMNDDDEIILTKESDHKGILKESLTMMKPRNLLVPSLCFAIEWKKFLGLYFC